MAPNLVDLKREIDALQLNIAGLFKLLGSDSPEDRLRFWEKFKGITRPAEFALVEHEIQHINKLVTQAMTCTKALTSDAKLVQGTVGPVG